MSGAERMAAGKTLRAYMEEHALELAEQVWGAAAPVVTESAFVPTEGRSPLWHIAETEPSRADDAAGGLVGRGFEVYAPTFTTTVKRGIRKQWIDVRKPLFPGYIFVRFDMAADPWERIFRVSGLRGLLCDVGKPAIVRDHQIAIVRDEEAKLEARAAENRKGRRRGKQPVPFKVGERVMVDDDIWGYQIGTIERLDDAGRIAVMMSLFSRQCRVYCSPGQIRSADSPS